jgi:hypothetical protein
MAWRTERQHLHRRASRAKMLEVIARIGGLHAQLLSSAELTPGLALKISIAGPCGLRFGKIAAW